MQNAEDRNNLVLVAAVAREGIDGEEGDREYLVANKILFFPRDSHQVSVSIFSSVPSLLLLLSSGLEGHETAEEVEKEREGALSGGLTPDTRSRAHFFPSLS